MPWGSLEQPKWGREVVATAPPICFGGGSERKIEYMQRWSRGSGIGTYAVTNELETCSREELDELCIELLVRVPRSAGHLSRGFQVEKHVNLSSGMLEEIACFGTLLQLEQRVEAYLDTATDTFHELLLREGLETSVDNGLVQLGLDFDVLRPNACEMQMYQNVMCTSKTEDEGPSLPAACMWPRTKFSSPDKSFLL
jgi:hypothetical protein